MSRISSITPSSGRRHLLVHRHRLIAFDDVDRVTAAVQERLELVVRNTREHGRSGDLVTVQVQDRQHSAVADRIEELVRVPAGRQRSGLRFTVADDARDQQIGVVECGAERVRERVTQSSALVDRARRLRGDVAGDAAGERELFEQLLHALFVLRHVGVHLAVGALEVGIGHDSRSAVAGAGDVDDAEVVRLDHAVQVDVEEVEPCRSAPVSQESRLDVVEREPLLEQRVVVQIDLSDGEIVRRAPIAVHRAKLFSGQRILLRAHGASVRAAPRVGSPSWSPRVVAT